MHGEPVLMLRVRKAKVYTPYGPHFMKNSEMFYHLRAFFFQQV